MIDAKVGDRVFVLGFLTPGTVRSFKGELGAVAEVLLDDGPLVRCGVVWLRPEADEPVLGEGG